MCICAYVCVHMCVCVRVCVPMHSSTHICILLLPAYVFFIPPLPPTHTSAGDSDDEAEGNSSTVYAEPILEPKDPYSLRPLPLLIGTAEFLGQDDVGLVDYASETEGVCSDMAPVLHWCGPGHGMFATVMWVWGWDVCWCGSGDGIFATLVWVWTWDVCCIQGAPVRKIYVLRNLHITYMYFPVIIKVTFRFRL